jgi:hypothetical protein
MYSKWRAYMDKHHRFTRLRAYMVMTDKSDERFDIGHFTLDFSLDDVPTCQISLAMGVDPSGKIATAHLRANEFAKRVPIQVYLEVSGQPYDGLALGLYLVFDGYISDVSPNRGTSAASLVVQAVHWLSDLTLSSKLSSITHPATSTSLLQDGLVGFNETPSDPYNKNFNGTGVADNGGDVWKAIRGGFQALADMNPMVIQGITDCTRDDRSVVVKRTLGRMDNPKEIDVVPLVLNAAAQSYLDHAFTTMGKHVRDPYTGTTFLDTLGFCMNQFMFHLVPNAASATCVPLIPQSGEAPYKTIYATEYDNARPSIKAGFPLRGLAFLSPYTTLAGDMSYTTMGNEKRNLAGYYDVFMVDSGADDEIREQVSGQVEMVSTPSWVSYENSVTNNIHYMLDTVGPDSRTGSRKGKTGGGGNTPVEDSVTEGRKNICQVAISSMGYRLAKAMYLDRIFKSRTASIMGKLRFDIAPGSCIAVETVGRAIDNYEKKMYGCVQSVRITVSALDGQAGTAFILQSIRSEHEQKLPGTTIREHPVFEKLWSGTYLAKPIPTGSGTTNLLNSKRKISAFQF